jgi:glycosyltransferase involved in cell wall biosynthesis
MPPHLSIITPIYNGAPFIRRRYWSLRNQTVDDWEWIVVDDGSTDDTATSMRELARQDSRIRFFQWSENRGLGCARTKALAEARGAWSVVSDVDDLDFPWRLEWVAMAMRRAYDFACSYVVVADPTMRILGVRDFERPLYTERVLAFTHPALACRTELAREIGYSPDLRTVNQIGEDKRLVLTLAARYRGYYHHAPLVIHQPSVGSLQRSIHSNIVGVRRVAQLFRDGTLPLSTAAYLRVQIRSCAKIGLLNVLRLKPSIYAEIMRKRRLGPPATAYRMTSNEMAFVQHYVGRTWDTSSAPASPRSQYEDLDVRVA